VIRDFPLPALFRDSAAAWLKDPAAAAAQVAGDGDRRPLRQAATVMVLRPAAGNLEVFMMRRNPGMAFAAGMHVFPGGGVDERDADPALGWFGPPPGDLAEVLAADEGHARALLAAAVRETFEECGVLLAGAGPDDLVTAVDDDGWERDRLALADGTVSLAEVLGRRGLGVRADLLRPWAHWVTPEFERRRFDTRFFVAALPQHQRARDLGGEADQAHWVSPQEALRRHDAGEALLLPPTRICLEELAAAGSVPAALGAVRVIRPVMPHPVPLDDGTPVLRVDLP
jgi:8-oxo-dGTP pyrophosphatase MutT (NUDIX family)